MLLLTDLVHLIIDGVLSLVPIFSDIGVNNTLASKVCRDHRVGCMVPHLLGVEVCLGGGGSEESKGIVWVGLLYSRDGERSAIGMAVPQALDGVLDEGIGSGVGVGQRRAGIGIDRVEVGV